MKASAGINGSFFFLVNKKMNSMIKELHWIIMSVWYHPHIRHITNKNSISPIPSVLVKVANNSKLTTRMQAKIKL
ncbi:hypothetical protein BBP14_08495 [Limosilactobacillus reuteri]|nr:hypothetical protein BBP10_02115 [Limosilactobacillus reuteri]OCW68345.1 hypothetical protein BBP14_08495 [Limosilactobacillus reuteri]OCW71612.1 hypothetical protein BBP13_01895 [Limosilactobacillus reuteri]